MYPRRSIASRPEWQKADGIKIYTASASGEPVERIAFDARLQQIKQVRTHIDWIQTPALAIFHQGESRLYLILAWWAEGHELFTSVSLLTPDGWREDPARYSFGVFDLEIFWAERNFFVERMYREAPDLQALRRCYYDGGRP